MADRRVGHIIFIYMSNFIPLFTSFWMHSLCQEIMNNFFSKVTINFTSLLVLIRENSEVSLNGEKTKFHVHMLSCDTEEVSIISKLTTFWSQCLSGP